MGKTKRGLNGLEVLKSKRRYIMAIVKLTICKERVCIFLFQVF